jgi:DNA-binding NtrC family response regulator
MADSPAASILIVDDVPENLRLLHGMLAEDGYAVRGVRSGEMALNVVGKTVPDLILLDINMPEMDGYEVCRRLKANKTSAVVPVVFLSALDQPIDKVEAFRVGGIDYITKPFHVEEVLARVAMHLAHAATAQDLAERNDQLEKANDDLGVANRELTETNQRLEDEIQQRHVLANKLTMANEREAARWGIEGIVGQSPLLRKILDSIKMLKRADSTSVLITGESGTGKELIARAVHANSRRADGPFIPVNCATVPRELAESLVFGHVKGAFTGADTDRTGYFDQADGGTLFLDEVGDMPMDLQVKLLRVLEDGRVTSLGAPDSHPVDVRIVAATNIDLATSIADGDFREDLFYRIARFTVEVPPLRERRKDIPLLAQHFLTIFADEMGIDSPMIASEAMTQLEEAPFRGNIRELKNVVERALIESRGGDITPSHLRSLASASTPAPQAAAPDMTVSLKELEVAAIEQALAKTGGNVSAAARMLGVDRHKVYRLLGKK